MQPIYWVLIALAVAAYIGIRLYLNARARVSLLREWAELNSYTFQRENDPSIGVRYGELTRLTQYQNCSAGNVIRGALGRYPFCAFDFVDLDQRQGVVYHRRSGPAATSFAAVVLETDLDLPSVIIERETLSDKVAKAFGAQDIQFDSEAFNRRFRVQGPNKDKVLATLGPTIQQFLIDTPLFEFSASLRTLQMHGKLILARSHSDQFFTEKVYPDVLEFLSALVTLLAASGAHSHKTR